MKRYSSHINLLQFFNSSYQRTVLITIYCIIYLFCHFIDNLQSEISKNCGFYLSNLVIAIINAKYEKAVRDEQKNPWHHIVKGALLEIYGDNIGYFSATGKGRGRPGRDKKLFKGLQGEHT